MFCSCILAIAILFGGMPNTAPVLQQESDSKSTAPQSQPQSQSPSAPAANPSETPTGAPDQSAAAKKEPEKPQDQSGAEKEEKPQDQPAGGKSESEKSKEPTSEPEKPKDTSQSGQSEGAPGEPAQPAPQSGEADKSHNPQPQPENKQQSDEKKATPCAPGSAQGNCAKPAAAQSHRIVIRSGGAGEPTAQLVPGMTPEQAAKHRQTTEQFLNSAEDNLRKLASRNLNQNQQDTITQIRYYMLDAHSALEDGDLSRARNLAFKAHLLADDLAKH